MQPDGRNGLSYSLCETKVLVCFCHGRPRWPWHFGYAIECALEYPGAGRRVFVFDSARFAKIPRWTAAEAEIASRLLKRGWNLAFFFGLSLRVG